MFLGNMILQMGEKLLGRQLGGRTVAALVQISYQIKNNYF
jgi:hypothetical protein